MLRYTLSIQTNTDGISINEFSSKKEALKEASYFRTGGVTWAGTFSAADNAHVHVYDTQKEEAVYEKPLFKTALKK